MMPANSSSQSVRKGIAGVTLFAFLLTQLAWPWPASAQDALRTEPVPETAGLEELEAKLQGEKQAVSVPATTPGSAAGRKVLQPGEEGYDRIFRPGLPPAQIAQGPLRQYLEQEGPHVVRIVPDTLQDQMGWIDLGAQFVGDPARLFNHIEQTLDWRPTVTQREAEGRDALQWKLSVPFEVGAEAAKPYAIHEVVVMPVQHRTFHSPRLTAGFRETVRKLRAGEFVGEREKREFFEQLVTYIQGDKLHLMGMPLGFRKQKDADQFFPKLLLPEKEESVSPPQEPSGRRARHARPRHLSQSAQERRERRRKTPSHAAWVAPIAGVLETEASQQRDRLLREIALIRQEASYFGVSVPDEFGYWETWMQRDLDPSSIVRHIVPLRTFDPSQMPNSEEVISRGRDLLRERSLRSRQDLIYFVTSQVEGETHNLSLFQMSVWLDLGEWDRMRSQVGDLTVLLRLPDDVSKLPSFPDSPEVMERLDGVVDRFLEPSFREKVLQAVPYRNELFQFELSCVCYLAARGALSERTARLFLTQGSDLASRQKLWGYLSNFWKRLPTQQEFHGFVTPTWQQAAQFLAWTTPTKIILETHSTYSINPKEIMGILSRLFPTERFPEATAEGVQPWDTIVDKLKKPLGDVQSGPPVPDSLQMGLLTGRPQAALYLAGAYDEFLAAFTSEMGWTRVSEQLGKRAQRMYRQVSWVYPENFWRPRLGPMRKLNKFSEDPSLYQWVPIADRVAFQVTYDFFRSMGISYDRQKLSQVRPIVVSLHDSVINLARSHGQDVSGIEAAYQEALGTFDRVVREGQAPRISVGEFLPVLNSLEGYFRTVGILSEERKTYVPTQALISARVATFEPVILDTSVEKILQALGQSMIPPERAPPRFFVAPVAHHEVIGLMDTEARFYPATGEGKKFSGLDREVEKLGEIPLGWKIFVAPDVPLNQMTPDRVRALERIESAAHSGLEARREIAIPVSLAEQAAGLEERVVIDGTPIPWGGLDFDGLTARVDEKTFVPEGRRLLAALKLGERQIVIPRAGLVEMTRIFRGRGIEFQASVEDALGREQIVDLPKTSEETAAFWEKHGLKAGDVIVLDVESGTETQWLPLQIPKGVAVLNLPRTESAGLNLSD